MKVGAKWDAIDIGQEAAYGAGMLVGVPQGISDSVESLSKAVTNPAATYDAIKQLITSDDMSSTMSDAVKQSYIDRINLMESEYQSIRVSEYQSIRGQVREVRTMQVLRRVNSCPISLLLSPVVLVLQKLVRL
ncbi:hypothetical protein [Enterobacter roggenkampii]|uniref:hypothetical protein n=1 Tax=Enterobacter roggenkampii TaxID=1812935 RepID=UPI002FFBD393